MMLTMNRVFAFALIGAASSAAAPSLRGLLREGGPGGAGGQCACRCSLAEMELNGGMMKEERGIGIKLLDAEYIAENDGDDTVCVPRNEAKSLASTGKGECDSVCEGYDEKVEEIEEEERAVMEGYSSSQQDIINNMGGAFQPINRNGGGRKK